jgi:NitT/TauT family transport system permease protein
VIPTSADPSLVRDRRARDREGWEPLPRRRPRGTGRLFAIREPIPVPATWLLTMASLLVPLAGWTLLSISGKVKREFLPTPAMVFTALRDMISSGQLWTDAAASMGRVGVGFGIAIAISVPLGILMGSFRFAEAVCEPVISLLRYLPAAAFIPLFIIWLGLGEPPKVAILIVGVVFFNTLMTADVVRVVPRALLEVSYTLGARRGEILGKVLIPHALPGIIDAMRVNAAAAWNFVIVAELIASSSGLGYRIVRSQRFLQTDRIFAVLIVIGLIGLVMDMSLRLLRARVGRWVR